MNDTLQAFEIAIVSKCLDKIFARTLVDVAQRGHFVLTPLGLVHFYRISRIFQKTTKARINKIRGHAGWILGVLRYAKIIKSVVSEQGIRPIARVAAMAHPLAAEQSPSLLLYLAQFNLAIIREIMFGAESIYYWRALVSGDGQSDIVVSQV